MEFVALVTIPIIGIIVVLLVLGFVLYIVNLLPIDPTFKRIIWAIVVFLAVVWLLQKLGFLGGLTLS